MKFDALDVLSWVLCAVGVAAYIVWWKHDVRTYPPRPAVISHIRL